MTYRVHLRPGGTTFAVEHGETVLEAAERQHIALPSGCQSGGCSACRARLIDGEIEYATTPHALAPAEIEAGYVLLCQARPLSDLTLAAEQLPPESRRIMHNMAVRVEHVERLSHDVAALHLKLPRGRPFAFRAGQYVDILLAGQRRRSFSIASPPSRTGELELHLRRVSGGEFTQRVFAGLAPKTILRIEGPLGAFYLRQSERPILMMAGGTGFAPVKSMIEEALEQGLQRPLHLYWGVRARRDLYLPALPERWAADHPNLAYTPVLSEPPPDERWAGRTGWVHEALVADYPDLRDFDVYISGPPPMIDAGKAEFSRRGLPLDRLFYDTFEYAYETWPERG